MRRGGRLLPFSLIPLLTGCQAPVLVRKVRDVSKCYLGSYRTVKVDGVEERLPQVLSLKFTKEQTEEREAEVSFDLSSSDGLVSFPSMDPEARFVDVCDVYRTRHGGEFSSFVSEGGWLEFWSSVSLLDGGSIVSAKSYLTESGKIVSFSVPAEDGASLALSKANVWKDETEWRFWKW